MTTLAATFTTLLTFLLLVFVTNVWAFDARLSRRNGAFNQKKAVSHPTALMYTIVKGIEPDEQDKEARELVKEMMKHRKSEHANDQYAGYDATQSEVDAINHNLNVDAYSNPIAGGIIPGIQLTSLCADD